MGFDPLDSWDFYDVPVPARPDPAPNGPRDRLVDMNDVVAVLQYVFADEGGEPNSHGIIYDSDKGVDTDGDTLADIPPDGVPDGRGYDRLSGAEPNPPWEAGPPDGVIDMRDVLAVLAQFGLDCSGP